MHTSAKGSTRELSSLMHESPLLPLSASEVDAVVISAPSVIPAVLSGANIAFIAGLHNR